MNDGWIWGQSPSKEMSGVKSLGLALTSHCCWTNRSKTGVKLKRSWCPCPGLVLLLARFSLKFRRYNSIFRERLFFPSVVVLSFTLAIYLSTFQALYLSHCDRPWKTIPWVPPFKSSLKWKTPRSFVRRKRTKAMKTQSQNCFAKQFYLYSSRHIVSQCSNSCVKL